MDEETSPKEARLPLEKDVESQAQETRTKQTPKRPLTFTWASGAAAIILLIASVGLLYSFPASRMVFTFLGQTPFLSNSSTYILSPWENHSGVQTPPPDPQDFEPPSEGEGWPPLNALSGQMLEFNKRGPWRNIVPPGSIPMDITLKMVPIVVYVHNRPSYLREVLVRLSGVEGINETLLIVSHDGYFPEMLEVVRDFTFMRIKQVFAPFSPLNFKDSFPNKAPNDCPSRGPMNTFLLGGSANNLTNGCIGDLDQKGQYRDPYIVGLKHHWFWLMNHVWDAMDELRSFDGHILFIEEDHLVVPNAYRTLQTLIEVKNARCPHCIAVSLSTGDRGHDNGRLHGQYFVADRMSNMGYAFNRTVWRRIKASARTFCGFDDYGWDWSLECAVMAKWDPELLSLHAAGASIIHAGSCGLHFNRGLALNSSQCAMENAEVREFLTVQANRPPPFPDWEITTVEQDPESCNYTGFAGWGDQRDQELCLYFAGLEGVD